MGLLVDEERVSEPENGTIKITQTEKHRETNTEKKIEWNYVTTTKGVNTHSGNIGRRSKKGKEETFKARIIDNFPPN